MIVLYKKSIRTFIIKVHTFFSILDFLIGSITVNIETSFHLIALSRSIVPLWALMILFTIDKPIS